MTNHSPTPLVTAIIRTHEGDAPLCATRAIPSVLAQDLSADHLQIIVVSDGQLSAPLEALLATALEDSRFPAVLLSGDKKYGYYCAPSNFATIEARGHYIAYLDADNEWRSHHLSTLLDAIRTPIGNEGWPHFVYSRRTYVSDPGAPDGLPDGDSPLVEWTGRSVDRLLRGPLYNFVDSSDFLISKSALYWLADKTGQMWNTNVRRFGDWELVARMAGIGFRARAVDTVSHIYHWTGKNLQLTRKPGSSDVVMQPTLRDTL